MDLDHFKRELIQVRPTREVCEILLEFLSAQPGADHAGICLWDENQGNFYVWPEDAAPVRHFMVFDPFLLHISDNDRIYWRNELEAYAWNKACSHFEAQRFFEALRADVVVPLVLNQSLVGVVFLALNAGGLATGRDTFETTLSEARSLAVMALSNSILYARLEGILSHLEEKVRERTRELENAQSQLVQSEKMAMLGVMSAGVAHEINTPASVIHGGLDNLRRNLDRILDGALRLSETTASDRRERCFRAVRLAAAAAQSELRAPRDAFRRKRELAAALEARGLARAQELAALFVENGIWSPQGSGAEGLDDFLRGDLLVEVQAAMAGASAEEQDDFYRLLGDAVLAARNLSNSSRAIQSITRIVRALKHYTHLDQSAQSEVDLHDGLENTLIIVGSVIRGEVEIVRRYGDLPLVRCNPDELNQVWTNLLTNAYQALKGSDQATITISTTTIDLWGGPGVEVRIADNGPGIDAQNLLRIWDPFFTTKDQGEGSGLGLGIVKGIIEKHKGRIEARSTPGAGAEFIVSLPVGGDPQKT